jgi:hypothetical protein
MKKTLMTMALAVSAIGLLTPQTAAYAQEAATSPKPAHYSVTETLVGTLLDDPAAVEILKRLIPTVYADTQFQSNGRSLTLKAIQTFVPDVLNDAMLATIQAEFDKLPAKG